MKAKQNRQEIVKEYRTDIKLEIALKGDRGIFLFLEQEGYNIPDDSNPKSITIIPPREGRACDC